MRGSDDVRIARPRRGRAVGLAALALLAACEGETLYETQASVDVPAPTVRILEPEDNQQVISGRRVSVRVFAADTLGVSEIEVAFSGVASGTILIPLVPARASVTVDTAFQLPSNQTGGLELRARARNTFGAVSAFDAVSLSVEELDTVAPTVARTAIVPSRIEVTDSIRVAVGARDNSGGTGIARVGATIVVARTAPVDTFVVSQFVDVVPSAGGTVVRTFDFAPTFIDAAQLPADLSVQVYGFALDEAGNCAAAVSDADQRLVCATFRGQTVAAAALAAEPSTVVGGRSIRLPAGSVVPDIRPDVPRRRLYLSNFGRNRVEILDLASRTFANPVAVGSQPWGLEINRDADTLIVANSGGTNISYVTLNGTPSEVVSQRIQTPNSVLFEINVTEDDQGFQRLAVSFFDFSDRPQYLAQDAFGRLLYSTRPTGAAGLGTIRVADRQSGWDAPEVKLLLGTQITDADTTRFAVAHVDSMRVFSPAFGNDLLAIWDHATGFPNQIVGSGALPLLAALDALSDSVRSDIRWAPGRFDLQVVGLEDTTFVARSADRSHIAFGEGGVGNGRIIMWRAPTSSISNEITIADLVGNASAHVVSLDMNADGSYNAAGGTSAAYLFKQDLRLQGQTAEAAGGPGAAAVLHPNHPTGTGFASGPTTLAFVAGDHSIRIYDTVHFHERGVIPLRDNIIGPLRASPPLAGDNAGCAGSECIVAKLYGVTDGGAVVVVDVRGRHIQ